MLSAPLDEALRLGMLYALRYERERDNHIQEVKDTLRARNCLHVGLIDAVLQNCGNSKRSLDLYKNEGVVDCPCCARIF